MRMRERLRQESLTPSEKVGEEEEEEEEVMMMFVLMFVIMTRSVSGTGTSPWSPRDR